MMLIRQVQFNTFLRHRIVVETKRCSVCCETKTYSKFSKDLRNADGKQGECKECKALHRKRLTQVDYDALLASQNGLCAICGIVPEVLGRKFAVDHDHNDATPTARGLLCSHCNMAIGLFGENTELMVNAIGYLQSHSVQIT
jgi:hypothetical protein